MTLRYLAWVCAGLVMAGGAAQAGTVTVAFMQPETFTDVRDHNLDASANLKTIADYLQWLGRTYLPPDQSLQIDVLDIDLAGKLRPTVRWGMVRVIGNSVDWPQMRLRYRLESGGQVVASGEQSLSDMGYAGHLDVYGGWDSLPYEKYMLKDWFRRRFAKN